MLLWPSLIPLWKVNINYSSQIEKTIQEQTSVKCVNTAKVALEIPALLLGKTQKWPEGVFTNIEYEHIAFEHRGQ